MARLARVVVPGLPHHVTQRGNRRQRTFFCDSDYRLYLNLLSEWCSREGVEIWGYCLMPNHVHLIAVPRHQESLGRALKETHRRYTSHVNLREGWRGYLWQGRFASYPMDENYLLAAARYIELNPVKARIVEHPEKYPWSSAAAHTGERDDPFVETAPLLERIPNWKEFLAFPVSQQENQRLHTHGRTGRPLGSEEFLGRIGKVLGRDFHGKKPGPKPESLGIR